MDEETFNHDLRRFLKQFGVTAQREIERAVDTAIRSGKLKGSERLKARARLQIDGVLDSVVVEDEIALDKS